MSLRHVPALVRGAHVRGARGQGRTVHRDDPGGLPLVGVGGARILPTCGTHLFYHLLPTDEYILSAGLFQDQGFELTGQIFIDEKPDFYALKNDTPTLTGQQVFEQFAPKP